MPRESSALDRPIISLAIRDWDDDSLNVMVVEEGKYRDRCLAVGRMGI
ncbi:hypothetical protein [Desulfosporosinus sp. HMP52]|nr:hypothetical protein [Desulfosporosinus sp. HMP52]